MAGDWIKMRAELYTHPRFMSLCSSLIYDEDRIGMLRYVCGEALGIGVMPPSNKTVTERALRCVTEQALRDVCMGALLRVWCAVNAHCKVDGDDAIMSPMSLADLDAIVGFADFGGAFMDAGWVKEGPGNSLRFPNFLEFNEPACLRKQPKTNAERQREWRERQKAAREGENHGEPTVTPVTKRNDRREKRREEKNTTVNGDGGSTTPASTVHRDSKPSLRDLILTDIREITRERGSDKLYSLIIDQCPESLIREAISTTKAAKLEGDGNGKPVTKIGAYFTHVVKALAKRDGIDLRFSQSRARAA